MKQTELPTGVSTADAPSLQESLFRPHAVNGTVIDFEPSGYFIGHPSQVLAEGKVLFTKL